MLTVATTPEGAAVGIDGKPAGMSPVTIEVRPGSHTLSLRREGCADEVRPAEAHVGRALVSSLDLRPVGK